MPAIMAKKKRPTDSGPSKRQGVLLGIRINEDLAAAMDAYLASTNPRISKTAFLEYVIGEELREHGHWPPPSEK